MCSALYWIIQWKVCVRSQAGIAGQEPHSWLVALHMLVWCQWGKNSQFLSSSVSAQLCGWAGLISGQVPVGRAQVSLSGNSFKGDSNNFQHFNNFSYKIRLPEIGKDKQNSERFNFINHHKSFPFWP